MSLNPDILDVLACPSCKGKLQYDKDLQKFVCKFEKVAYPIENGVPVLQVEKAELIVED